MAHHQEHDRVRPPSPVPGAVLTLSLLGIAVGAGLEVFGVVTFISLGIIVLVLVSIRYWFITRVYMQTRMLTKGTIVAVSREGVRTSYSIFDTIFEIIISDQGWSPSSPSGKPTWGRPVVLVEFGTAAGQVRLRARISEDLYEILPEGEEWEITYAEADPRFALLRGECMSWF